MWILKGQRHMTGHFSIIMYYLKFIFLNKQIGVNRPWAEGMNGVL